MDIGKIIRYVIAVQNVGNSTQKQSLLVFIHTTICLSKHNDRALRASWIMITKSWMKYIVQVTTVKAVVTKHSLN